MNLTIIDGKNKGEVVQPKEGITKMGRSSRCDFFVDDEKASGNHIEIRFENEELFITDMSSRNGTFLNGNRIDPGEEIQLFEGDRVVIGLTVYEIRRRTA